MVSLEHLAVVRLAIELCNNDELKQEALCAPGSEYERKISGNDSFIDRESKWKDILENKTTKIVENLGLPKALLEKVTGLVILIGLKMLTWLKYHVGNLDLSPEFSSKFLKSAFFTSRGIIDNAKAARELMKESSLNITQKYTLSCLYCFTDRIPDLYRQMSQEDINNNSQRINYPEIVKFWSDYLTGEVEKLRGEKTLDQYMLEKAIESGSKATVEYCLEEKSISGEEGVVIDAALERIRKTDIISILDKSMIYMGSRPDYIWNPEDYFLDTLCFLLSRMSEEKKVQFLKDDSDDSPIAHVMHPGSRVLKCFLDWPYQDHFMKTAELMWDFLPKMTYVALLLKMCYKINPGVVVSKFRQDRSYDYRSLLKEFWDQSPDRYKRYALSDKVDRIFFTSDYKMLTFNKNLLVVELFTLENDTYKDGKVFELILDSATNEEREKIIFSEEGRDICVRLMKGQQWKVLDKFLSECISSGREAEGFKRSLSFTEEARSVFAYFIKHKWEAAEFFIKWSSLPEEEITRFKRETISSRDGRDACSYLFLHKGGEAANRFCEWSFSSEEDVREFKKEMIFSVGLEVSADLIIEDKLEVVDAFVKWSHLSQEEISEFKKHLQLEKGSYICEKLITGDVRKRISKRIWYMFDPTIQFRGGKWEQVEKFLTWCFSSEEEIRDFKKGRLLKVSGAEIHFCLVEANQWGEAETFFAWMELSPDEVKELKKETLFGHGKAKQMLVLLMYGKRDNEELSDYENRQEGIGLVLRWHLTDKETVLEFRDHFKQKYEKPEMSEGVRTLLKKFDSAIEERLSELDEEQRALSTVELIDVNEFNFTPHRIFFLR